MSRASNLIGKTMTHPDLGRVKVKAKKSNVIVTVVSIDKGQGWDERSQSYKGHKNCIGWMRGENREHGKEDEVHIKDLK